METKEIETIQAKIRNKLIPILNLIELIECKDYSAEEKVNLIKKYKLLTLSKIHCDKIIKIADQADKLI